MYYAVRKGLRPGIYRDYKEVRPLVDNFKGAEHKKFNSLADAEHYMRGNPNPPTKAQSISEDADSATNRAAVCCERPLRKLTALKEGPNQGREFYKCPNCQTFTWVDGRPNQKGASDATNASAGHESPSLSLRDGDLVIYTDGSCIGNVNVAESNCPAGWSAVVLNVTGASASFSTAPNSSENGMTLTDELFGPVWKDPSSPFYLGATVGSNNTGELSAIGEAFMYVRDIYLPRLRQRQNAIAAAAATAASDSSDSKNSNGKGTLSLNSVISASRSRGNILARPGLDSSATGTGVRPAANSLTSNGSSSVNGSLITVVIRYDSEYAANSAIGKFNGPKNRQLVTTVNGLYRELCAIPGLRVLTQKVKAHSGETWNERADQLANMGARGDCCTVGRYDTDRGRGGIGDVGMEALPPVDLSSTSGGLGLRIGMVSYGSAHSSRRVTEASASIPGRVGETSASMLGGPLPGASERTVLQKHFKSVAESRSQTLYTSTLGNLQHSSNNNFARTTSTSASAIAAVATSVTANSAVGVPSIKVAVRDNSKSSRSSDQDQPSSLNQMNPNNKRSIISDDDIDRRRRSDEMSMHQHHKQTHFCKSQTTAVLDLTNDAPVSTAQSAFPNQRKKAEMIVLSDDDEEEEDSNDGNIAKIGYLEGEGSDRKKRRSTP